MEKYDIIVVAGQSNAEGYGLGPVTQEYIPSEDVMMLQEDHFQIEVYDADGSCRWRSLLPRAYRLEVADVRCDNGEKVGQFQLPFARAYYDAYLTGTDRKVLVVQAALGGSGFLRGDWAVEDHNLFDRLVDMTQYALSLNPENRLAAFLWHQGETDALMVPDMPDVQRLALHKRHLGRLLDGFCRRFDCEGIPMLSAGFVEEWYLLNKSAADAVLDAVREVLSQQGGVVLDTAGLQSNNQRLGNGDNIHFCRESQHILGNRLFDAYRKIRNT